MPNLGNTTLGNYDYKQKLSRSRQINAKILTRNVVSSTAFSRIRNPFSLGIVSKRDSINFLGTS